MTGPKIEHPRALAEALKACHDPVEGPLYFFREILGARPTDEQIPIIEAFPHHRRIAVKSGHSNGKDWLAARLALYFHLTRYPSIVVLTGPTDRQVKQVVWGEIKAAHRNARYEIGGEMFESQLKSGDPRHYMIGFTASSAEAFQGFHSENVLVVVTEAPGVAPRMWPGIESLLTSIGDARLLSIGNATYDPDSEFYAMFTRHAALYRTFTLDSERSPYCSKAWIDEMRQEHGEDGPVYQARVKGIFPTDVADTLVPLAWIERAHERWRAGDAGPGPESLGLDIARFGSDQTVFVRGDGLRYRVAEARQGQDLMQTAGRTIAFIRDERIPAEQVRVDDTGLGGGVTDRLREENHAVRAINFGAKAYDDAKFANARSEMFWALRERFRTGEIAIDPADTKLLRDLSVLRYKYPSSGKIQLEEKSAAKSRLGYSPDRADALALAALPGPIADKVASRGKPGWGLLELARQQAMKGAKKPDVPVNARPMTEVPGAAAVLQERDDEPARRAAAWRSLEEHRLG